MQYPEDRQLIAHLAGELDAKASAELDRRRRQEPRLEQRYQWLRSSWNTLELAPPPAPLAGSAQRMLASRGSARGSSRGQRFRVMGQDFRVLGHALGGAAALAAGLALGIGLGTVPTMANGTLAADAMSTEFTATSTEEVLLAESLTTDGSSLSDTYWRLVSEESQ